MNKKNKKNTIIFLGMVFAIVFSFSFSFFLFSNEVNAQGLVPCATSENPRPCTLCDLIVGIKNIIDWGRTILVAVALTAITIGGVMYIVSAGNEQMMQMAKNIITQALWGVVIVLGAWLIINTTMWLLATNDMSADRGTLGINVVSWSEFTCDGNVVFYEDNDAVNGGDGYSDPEADNPESSSPVCGSTPNSCEVGTPGGYAATPGGTQIWDCVVGEVTVNCS